MAGSERLKDYTPEVARLEVQGKDEDTSLVYSFREDGKILLKTVVVEDGTRKGKGWNFFGEYAPGGVRAAVRAYSRAVKGNVPILDWKPPEGF